MEAILNAFWLLVALASLWLWRWHRSRLAETRCLRKARLRGLVTLGLALLLLFPVISLTDDLHAELVLAEEANSSRRTLKSWAGMQASSNSGKPGTAPPSGVLPQLFSHLNPIAGWISSSDFQLPTAAPISVRQGRAPPSSDH